MAESIKFLLNNPKNVNLSSSIYIKIGITACRRAERIQAGPSSHTAARASGAGGQIPRATGHRAAGIQAEPGYVGVWRVCSGLGLTPSSLRFF